MSTLMAWICPKCGLITPRETESVCENCKTPLICTQVSAEEILSSENDQLDEWIKSMQQKYVIGYETKAEEKSPSKDGGQYIPKCPTCGCPDVSRIPSHQSSLDINNSVMAIVTNRTGKTFVCNNCGYTW